MVKSIAAHVHCRDGKEAYKDTILNVSLIARMRGIKAIFDMPNTDPPILREKDVEERLKLAKENSLVDYYLFVGLTSNEGQIKEAVELAKTNPKVVGLKLYTSDGDLKVAGEKEQNEIYKVLSGLDYKGVLAVHCEKESKMKPELWNPEFPLTHCRARPPESEIESIRDQIKFAKDAGFLGHFHICHISCPESVDLVLEAKKDLKITCAITPHHLLFSDFDMWGEKGIVFKVNPPLRDIRRVKILREYLLSGKIDWIEPDHARHAKEEKFGPPWLSGIPTLDWWSKFLRWLSTSAIRASADEKELGLSEEEIKKLVYDNIEKVFGLEARSASAKSSGEVRSDKS